MNDYQQLKKVLASSKIDEETFFALLDQVALQQDPLTIDRLLECLNDQLDPFIFQSILHVMENFDDETYIGRILINFPLLEKMPDVASIIFSRIINNKKSKPVFENKLAQLSSSRQDHVLSLLRTWCPQNAF